MSGGKLEVQIGADKTDFDKKIKEIEYDIKELSKVKLDRLKVGLDTTEINSQIKDAKNNLNQLKSTVKDTGQTFSGMAPKVANGGNALMQFSRIAQDAPFGIIGIGNNITATVESFGYLKNATGSTGGALKALGQSIMGSGGILLGVSLLTTGLTYMAQSGLSVGDVIDKLTGSFDSYKQTIDKIATDSAKNSASEISTMKALVSVAQDDTKSRKDRLLAVQELQSTYPAYFGNLSKEYILNGNLTGATNELTRAIIARAEATALADEIGKLASQKLDLQIQKEKAILKLKEAQANVKGAVTVTGGTMGATGLSNEGQLASATSRVKDLNVQILEVQTQQDKLAGMLNEKTAESIKLKEKEVKATKTYVTPQVTAVQSSLLPAGLADVSKLEALTGKVDEFGNKIKELPGIMHTSFPPASNTVSEETAKMLLALQDFNSKAGAIITDSIANTFIGLGEAIGNALATGSDILSAVGASLLSSLGNILTDMGKMAIQVGVGLLAIKTALKSLNPAVAIGAGVALIALGSFFSAKSSSIGGGIGGGGGASSSSGSGANNSSFTSSGFASNSGGGTVVFEIAGTKLIGVLSNTINSNKRLGGQLGLG
ncbi:MAG: Flavobacterium phage 11b [Bacteroidota bacterium]|jgi:hypothetical protein